jgi:hypothetical protein
MSNIQKEISKSSIMDRVKNSGGRVVQMLILASSNLFATSKPKKN